MMIIREKKAEQLGTVGELRLTAWRGWSPVTPHKRLKLPLTKSN
jgi:hypothetical protein